MAPRGTRLPALDSPAESPAESPVESPAEHAESPADSEATAPRPRGARRPALIAVVAAAATVALVAGAGVAVAAQERAAYTRAQEEYAGVLDDIAAVESAVGAAATTHVGLLASVDARVAVAEQIVPVLTWKDEALAAATEATADARRYLESVATLHPPGAIAPLTDKPTRADYEDHHAAATALLTRWRAHRGALDAQVSFTAGHDAGLLETWAAAAASAPGIATAVLEAGPNAGQASRDAVTAAAAAIAELPDPLDPAAVELWTALADAAATVAAEEAAYQEEQARRAAVGGRRGSASGGGWSPDGTCQSAACYTGPSREEIIARGWREIVALVAREQNVPESSVSCFYIPNGVRCEWPGGWREVTI